MKVLINLENTDNYKEISIEKTDLLENLKYIIEAEFNIPFNDQEIIYNSNVLSNNNSTIENYKIGQDDLIVLRKKKKLGLGNIFDSAMKNINVNPTQPNMFSQENIKKMQLTKECIRLKTYYRSNPSDLSILMMTDEELANAIISENDPLVESILKVRIEKMMERKKKEKDELDLLERADPNDAEAQKRISQIINRKNIDENLQYAQENLPESFSFIHMLYMPVEINKIPINAFIDTGAQTTIMSEKCAERCGLSNLIDTRYSGIAKGVGTSKIVGVVHAALLKVGSK